MTTNRRDFIRLSAVAAGGTLGLGLHPLGVTRQLIAQPSKGALRILFLGGTGFIGPFQVRYALERGHEVTLFNRGRTAPGLFPDVETLIGDRNGELSALEGKSWDVVIDNSRQYPRWVRLTAELLRDSVDRYMYVSSRSAYADTSVVPMTAAVPSFTYETAGVPRDRDIDNLRHYGLAKAESEREVRKVFGDRTVVFRPGLIVGPEDETDRFTYWPVRIHRGGEILAPGDGTDPVQFIDVRDFAEWMIRCAEDEHTGLFNVVGPATPRPMAELLYGIRAVTTAETTFTWVDYDFMDANRVRGYSEMPVWRAARGNYAGFAQFDLTPEVERGLTFRPLADTARDTLEYHFSRPLERQQQLSAGISAEREAEVLALWHARG